MYQLWHEDRTAAANGIEARVPFLDHRLVEFTYEVPPNLHRDLFWDKTILREALKDWLPPDLCRRPKTPFFCGEDLRYTRRLQYNLLYAENGALIEEAMDEAADVAGVVNRKALWRLFKDLPHDPEYGNVDLVLDIVNMGLLAAMARAQREPESWHGELSVSEVVVDDWSAWEEHFSISLVRRTPALGRASVVAFADGIRVVKSETGDPRLVDESGYYILRNDALEFSLEAHLEPWVKFLRNVDGVRTVAEILTEAGVTEREVWKHLEEAIEYDVLRVSQARDSY
jgi:asparagine synthase (glutamine-hydrolysing)